MIGAGKIVVFDIETGGFDAERHPLVQIAAVAYFVRDGAPEQEIEALELKVAFDPKDCEPGALEVNSYDPLLWKEHAMSPGLCAREVAAFLARHATVTKVSKRTGRPYTVARLCGHNASGFDGPFLLAWFKRQNVFLPAAAYEALDTLHLARWLIPPGDVENYRLETLCRHLGVELSAAHDALADARATAEIAQLLMAQVRR